MSSFRLARHRTNDLQDELRRAGGLRQIDEEWPAAARLANMWNDKPDGSFVRPTFICVLRQSGGIRLVSATEDAVEPDDLLSAILQSMYRPVILSGGKRRPARIVVDDPALATAIAPHLASIGVECVALASVPFIDRLTALIAKQYTGDDPIPGLLHVQGFSVPAMTHLFELAAEYHRLAPWRYFGDRTPIAITTGGGADERFAIVMGNMGEVFGLSVYDTLEDFQAIYDNPVPDVPPPGLSWFVLFFETARAATFDDLDAIERFGLPIAADNAFPNFGRASGIQIGLPSPKDLRFMEPALAALNAHFKGKRRRDGSDLWPVDREIEVEVVGGREVVRVRGEEGMVAEGGWGGSGGAACRALSLGSFATRIIP